MSQAREVAQERQRPEPGEEEQEERAECLLQREESEEIPPPLGGLSRVLETDPNMMNSYPCLLNYNLVVALQFGE